MKIVHVISGIGGGGRERRMGQIVIDLLHRQFGEQHIIYFSKSNNDYAEIVRSGAQLHLLEYHSKCGLVKCLKKEIRQISPDIVHVWTEIPVILAGLTLLKFVLHYKLIIGFIADGNIIRRWHSKLASKLSFFFADAIVSNSYAGLKAKGAKGNKCHVIYNGFDFDRLTNNELCRDHLLKSFSEDHKYFICMVARFSPAKDWCMFLNVAEAVYEQRQDILFLAVGSGETLSFYKQTAQNRNLNNVRFLGHRNDIESIINVCDISLLFSDNTVHAEGVSNVIMETMASSKPIIATAGGGTAEIINDKYNGYIVAPGDVNAAVNIILQLIKDPKEAEKVSRNAFKTISSKFCQSDKTQEYIDLYNSIS